MSEIVTKLDGQSFEFQMWEEIRKDEKTNSHTKAERKSQFSSTERVLQRRKSTLEHLS